MAAYQYKRLVEPRSGSVAFRLLKLLPGSFDDDICLSIYDASFAVSSGHETRVEAPWYALSYTWGDLQNRAKVFVQTRDAANDATAKLRHIWVTQTLVEALRHIRSRNEEKHMWIDAI